jgi:hypothetical protein
VNVEDFVDEGERRKSAHTLVFRCKGGSKIDNSGDEFGWKSGECLRKSAAQFCTTVD